MENETIYFKGNNSIVTYDTIYDRKELENLVDEIDTFYGKGVLYNEMAMSEKDIYDDAEGRKIEIVSSSRINNHFIEFNYYKFYANTVSKLITRVLNSKDSIEFSHNMKDLLKYRPRSNEEKTFYKKALQTFKYEKSKIDNLSQVDLTIKDLDYKIKKIKAKLLFKEEPTDTFVITSTDFENDLNNEVTRLEKKYNNGKQYDSIQSVNTKKRIIKALPSLYNIKKDI